MDADSSWMLMVCILASVAYLGHALWIFHKRDTAGAAELLQSSSLSYVISIPPTHFSIYRNSWRSDRDLCDHTRRRDIKNNLQVGEWLTEGRLTDVELVNSIDNKTTPDTVTSTSTVDNPMDRLRDASRLVSSSHGLSSGECAICLTALHLHGRVCKANHVECVHVFPADCMKRWPLHQNSCPICRVPYR